MFAVRDKSIQIQPAIMKTVSMYLACLFFYFSPYLASTASTHTHTHIYIYI